MDDHRRKILEAMTERIDAACKQVAARMARNISFRIKYGMSLEEILNRKN